MHRVLVALALPLPLITGCAPPLPSAFARAEELRVARSPVVDISQWPDRDHIGAVLLRSAAPLVTFDGVSLVPLPSCALAGRFSVTRPPPSLASSLLRSEAELHARFPLRDPSLTLAKAAPGRPPPPLFVASQVAEEWHLASIEHNALPEGTCAKATHVVTGVRFGASALRPHTSIRMIDLDPRVRMTDVVDDEQIADDKVAGTITEACAGRPRQSAEGPAAPVGCSRPLSLTLTPLGRDVALEDATLDRFAPPEGERWSLAVAGAPPCDLPCDRWLLPGASATLTRGREASAVFVSTPPYPREQRVQLGYVKDPLHPLPWAVTAPVGAGFVAAAVGLGLSSPAGPAESPGSSGVATGAAKNILGLGALGALGAVIAVGSLVGLARGPRLLPRFTTRSVEAAPPPPQGKARRPRRVFTPTGAIAF